MATLTARYVPWVASVRIGEDLGPRCRGPTSLDDWPYTYPAAFSQCESKSIEPVTYRRRQVSCIWLAGNLCAESEANILKKVLAVGDRLLGFLASTATTGTTVCECAHDHPLHGPLSSGHPVRAV
jgi:hypothetical protein